MHPRRSPTPTVNGCDLIPPTRAQTSELPMKILTGPESVFGTHLLTCHICGHTAEQLQNILPAIFSNKYILCLITDF